MARKGRHLAKKKKHGVMDIILVVLAIVLIAYVVVNLIIFAKTGMEPSTLTACVFGVATGELGIMGWIKSSKEKQREKEENTDDS